MALAIEVTLTTRRIGRFLVRRPLGQGAYGEVFEVEDLLVGERLALKKLRTTDPGAIYQFKREFRALADVLHPNLVRFYDLFVDGDDAWLTMDLVEGEDLVSAARRPGVDVRELLRQLVAGVTAIHRGKQLHRDLKPANVLVTRDGSVVILDFGLATASVDASLDPNALVGTPMYIAPEQVVGGTPTEASDWYAVGVILYQLLTGAKPFTGSLLDVLRQKERGQTPAVLDAAPDAPADLAALCGRLMARDPAARPRAAEIAAALGVDPRAVIASRPDPAFVGRADALARLDDAFARAHDGVVVALVRGESGVGKSALVSAFLRARSRDGVRVLRGRCYERESMPFKAVDGLVDAVARAVGAACDAESSSPPPPLPPGIAALAQIFPSILRVEALAKAAAGELMSGDLHEVRRLGFAALARLIAGLGDRGPVIAFIDDLQWGDPDSAELLVALLTSGVVTRGLFLIAHRAEDDGPDGRVRTLCARVAAAARAPEVAEVRLDPLPEADALALARESLDDDQQALAAAIVAEAGGNPFLVQELGRASARRGASVKLTDVVDERIVTLGAAARALLEVVATAGYPLAADVAHAAAGGGSLSAALAELRLARLLRTRDGTHGLELECFHDRVRAAVTARLARDGRLAGRHLALGDAIEASGRADAERLAVHFDLAGVPAKASRYAETAAAAAAAALAFDRAVALTSLALAGAEPADRHRLQVRLAEALALAGRPRLAADAFLAAAGDAPDPGAERALRRLAADQLLRGGYLAEGTALVRRCLADVQVGFPATSRRALASALWQRVRVRLHLLFGRRARRPSPPPVRERLDTVFAAGLGLSQIAPYLSVGFLSRHLVMALRHGDHRRLASAFALEAVLVAAGGDHARGVLLAARSREAAAACVAEGGDGGVAIWPHLADGHVAFLRSHWGDARAAMREAIAVAARHGAGAWEIGTAHYYCMMVLTLTGEYGRLATELATHIRDAQERGDLYTELNLRLWCSSELLLSLDRPDEAEREAAGALARWTGEDYQLQHSHATYARILAALYVGDAAGARALALDGWARGTRSGLLHTRLVQMRCREEVARTALALGGDDALRDARRQAAALAREGIHFASASALQIEAALALAAGHRDRALTLMAQGESLWAEQDTLPRVLSLRRARALLLDDAALLTATDAAMRAAGIHDPARFARAFAPGFGP